MNRGRKIIRNIVIIVILFFVYISSTGLYITPLSAHENSERSFHYGPSEIVHVEDFDKDKYFLCKYDRWVSCDRVEEEFFFLWRFGSSPNGFENDLSKPVDFSRSYEQGRNLIYGIINNNEVKKVQFLLSEGTVFEQTKFYDGLFLIPWDNKEVDIMDVKIMKAYNENDEVIYEKNIL